MSDLISREFLQTAIHNFFYGLNHTPTEEDIQRYIEVAPSADIMECARAMKSFCWKTDCANCPIFLQCGEAGVRPCDWDLPEGEKKSCNTCKNNDDEFSGECYECVKNIQNHYEPEGEVKPNEHSTNLRISNNAVM